MIIKSIKIKILKPIYHSPIKKLENELFKQKFSIRCTICTRRRIRTCQVMVDKLPPLHQHMSDRLQRNVFILVNYCAYQSRAWKRFPSYRSPDTLNSIPVNWWQESDEQKSLSTFVRSISETSLAYISQFLASRPNHLSIADMAEPHQRCFKLLQLPSDVLYLKLAGGQSGTPLFGQLRRSGSL